MAERVTLTSEQIEALMKLRAQYDTTSWSEVNLEDVDDETCPHKALILAPHI